VNVTHDPIENLRDLLAHDKAMRDVVDAILNRCDRAGTLPARMTIRCQSAEERQAAIRLLSAAAVHPIAGGDQAVWLDLARADARLRETGGPGLSEVLYAAAGMQPRNLREEAKSLGAHAARLGFTLAEGHRGAAAGFLQEAAQRLAACRGELFELVRSQGLAQLERELDFTARCIELAEFNEKPVRLANFARRTTGSSKGLRAGDRRYIRVADALLARVPGLAGRVAAEGWADHQDRRRIALECLNIFRNETPIDVLCWGRFVLEKQGRRLDAPALHHDLGEPCRLLLLHLRDARVSELRAEKIISIENETTFNDYTDWLQAAGRDEIVLLSEGQANWAVVRLLRLLAEKAPSIPIEHWGDMDRFGVLILRSLRRRTGLNIEPRWMDVSTFERCATLALPLPDSECDEIDRLLAASDGQVGSDLLRTLRQSRQWLEQEAVAEEVLGVKPVSDHRQTRV